MAESNPNLSGEMLYHVGVNDNDSDLWDDTALIKAYDQAVNTIKRAVKEPSHGENGENRKNQQQKSRKNKKNKNKDRQVHNWEVGSRCRATYAYDGVDYDAVIISIDRASRSCVVIYRDFGNEEEQFLDDLLPPLPNSETHSKDQTETDTALETDSGEDSRQSSLSSLPNSRPPSNAGKKCTNHHHHGNGSRVSNRGDHGYSDHGGSMPSLKTSTCQGAMAPPLPPAFPFFMNGLPSNLPGPFGGLPNAAFPPPSAMPLIPPPLLPDASSITDDKDALYGMLISWYMSGYHTGYYQCLRETQKRPKPDEVERVSFPPPSNPSSIKRQSSKTTQQQHS